MDLSGVNNPAYTHGHTEGGFSPEYYSWASMKSRCNNSNTLAYKYYGGRGIKVCPRWEKFEFFLEDMGARPSRLFSLDRINVDGDYEPSNCRWADRGTQTANRRPGKWDKMSKLLIEIVSKGANRTDLIQEEYSRRNYVVHEETIRNLCRKAVNDGQLSKSSFKVKGEHGRRNVFNVCIHNGRNK